MIEAMGKKARRGGRTDFESMCDAIVAGKCMKHVAAEFPVQMAKRASEKSKTTSTAPQLRSQ